MLWHRIECQPHLAFEESPLFCFKRQEQLLPFSKVTFSQLLARAAEHVGFSPCKPYAFRRGAHTNLFMANDDELIKCSPRTLKTVGNHAITYNGNYVSVDLENLALKFA